MEGSWQTLCWCVVVLLAGSFAVAGASPWPVGHVHPDPHGRNQQLKIMWIIHEIADVYGPRVTGTPNLKAADDWAVKTMTSWGLANAHLEPWTFQPPSAAKPVAGWENMELTAVAVAPFHGQLMVEPLAWTPSTKGAVTAQVVLIQPPGMTPPAGGGFGGFGAPAPAATAPSGARHRCRLRQQQLQRNSPRRRSSTHT